jgi:hypothetical protein
VTTSIVVLTEQALGPDDAKRIVGLHEPAPTFRVLVPADTGRSLLADVLDHLSLLELREALGSIRGKHDEEQRADAGQALESSLATLRGAGAEAEGVVVHGDPLTALQDAVLAADPARTDVEVVVVTRPHAVEDTFHTDWASKARERLQVPVLHVYAGSNWLG